MYHEPFTQTFNFCYVRTVILVLIRIFLLSFFELLVLMSNNFGQFIQSSGNCFFLRFTTFWTFAFAALSASKIQSKPSFLLVSCSLPFFIPDTKYPSYGCRKNVLNAGLPLQKITLRSSWYFCFVLKVSAKLLTKFYEEHINFVLRML